MTTTAPATMRRTSAARWLLAGLFVAALSGHATLASHRSTFGPVFTSSKDISEAQTILERDRYLNAGSYTRGDLDQPTIDALRGFQRSHFLRPTGQLDPDTMGELTSHLLIGGSTQEAGAAASGASATGAGSKAPATSGGPGQQAALSAGDRANRPSHDVREARQMPRTGSPFALEILAGAALLAAGGLLLRRHAG